MSVRPEFLSTSEGALVSISIAVQPAALESLLEALAVLDFPVNPQIYHDGAVISRFADGHEECEPATLVEFPAYLGQVDQVRDAVISCGLDPACIQTIGMLEEIQSGVRREPAPAGAPYVERYRVKAAHACRG